ARNQMKAVLRKLGIGSQSELVSLYAGFAGSLALREVAMPQDDPAALGHEVAVGDGPPLKFERFGKAGGKPVLLLHGAIEGPFLTPNLQQRAHAAGLELFVPWMPFYSDRDRPSDPRARIEWFVQRLDRFCEALQIARCPILACSLSSAYGLAALKRWPDRFLGMVACGFIPPFDKLGELGELNPLWRAPLVLGRTVPGAVDLLVRSIVRLAMRGEAYRYFDRLLKDSPIDRMTLRQPDIGAVVRKAFRTRPDKAGRAFAHALQVQVLDWGEWLEGHSRPVRIVIGEHDVVHAPHIQRAFCERCGFEAVGPLADAGGFTLFQQPQRVFSEVRSLLDE
ncbi:MAG: alpha/beta hydrolase, partial [Pseudomonadota bacterium]